jgi:hypothetical protein
MSFLVRKVTNFILIIISIFYFLPIVEVFALSPEAESEKNDLIATYNVLKVKLDDAFDDLIEWTDEYSDEISESITLSFLSDFYNQVSSRNIEGCINVFLNYLPADSEAVNELRLIKPKVTVVYDDAISLKRDIFSFIEREKNNLRVNDVLPLLKSNVDIFFKTVKLTDNFSVILSNSIVGGIDFKAIVREEFKTEIDKISNIIDDIIERGNNTLNSRLCDIKNDTTKSTTEKVNAMMDIIDQMLLTKEKGLSFYNEVQTKLTDNNLKSYVSQTKNKMIEEIDKPIIKAKKYMLDSISNSDINNTIGNSKTNQIIEEIYGVKVTPNPFISLKSVNKYLISNKPINDVSELSAILSNQYGILTFNNLVSNKIATGSTLTIGNGTENMITYQFVIKGDLLGRATTDVTDLFRLIDDVLGSNPLGGIFREAGDMNSDGNNDISDIIKLIDTILTN